MEYYILKENAPSNMTMTARIEAIETVMPLLLRYLS